MSEEMQMPKLKDQTLPMAEENMSKCFGCELSNFQSKFVKVLTIYTTILKTIFKI